MTRDEARETSGATTGGLLRFVRAQAGDDAVAEVLRRAGVPYTADELEDQSRWWSYDTRIRLFAAATDVLDDPDTMYEVGAFALQSGLAHSLVLLLRAMGTPRQVFRQLPRAVTKFSTTSTMRVLDVGSTSATIHYRLHEGYQHSRLDCVYAQGLLSTVPAIFGLPPADIRHDRCESDGHEACIYELTWDRRARLRRRGHGERSLEPELHALRGQLRILQSAATDLVASDDLGTVLHRIVSRAAEAVLAPAYLLAVRAAGDGEPLVDSAGLPPEQVADLAARLLDDGDLGPGAVVVDVASTRRSHGRLAALYPSGNGAVGEEAAMLAAYAGHAAAALDVIVALDEARQEADRAGALLALAHQLAGATDADAICRVVAEALPRIVGCRRASVLLWDPAAGHLEFRAHVGLGDNRTLLETATVRAEDTPELLGMITDRAPRVLTDEGSSPVLQGLLRALGTGELVAVPLQAGNSFLGVATVGWEKGQANSRLVGDALARLLGVADQASTALQKARLLETVRHQATHDALTGLPNRVLFLERLDAALTGVDAGNRLAVLFCDLDLFKQVNDTFGHAAGDELLRQVSARLRAAVRPGDTVGRLSGDEFAVILPGLVGPDDADGLIERVADCFTEPFRLEGTDVAVGASVGVALHDGIGEATADRLMRRADAEMYRCKQHGRDGAPASS